MPQIRQRPLTYIIGKPTIIPADAIEINLDDLADEINRLGQASFDAQGTDDGKNAPLPSAKIIRKLSTDKGELESLVVEMTDELKAILNERHKETIIIEHDEPIYPINMEPSENSSISLLQNTILTSDTNKLTIMVAIKDDEGRPVSNARVTVSGLLWVESGLTNKNGKIKLTLQDETKESISSIEVKPAHTFWSLRINQPVVSDTEDNEVVLSKIDSFFSDNGSSVKKQYIGWGQKDMNLNVLPKQSKINNKRVKIAVIDSGISENHSDLSPKNGFDFGETLQPNESWRKDGSGHGTHVSGICVAENNEFGILGFASNAELIVLRVFPNASNSKLMAALDWCIDNDVDVINMSLGGKNASKLVQQRLQSCREKGILPIAAAGNNGGKVLFPAAFDEVLSVAAIGRVGSFPEDSSHQKHIGEKPIQSGQYFSPKFTCRGPEIDVCAPGVAIVSTVPKNEYAAWDGTSMACPHVSGFAARILQIKPKILNLPRTSERSQNLFDAILNSCTFLEGIPPTFQGKGMPVLPVESENEENTTSNGNAYLKDVSKLIDEAILAVETHLDNH